MSSESEPATSKGLSEHTHFSYQIHHFILFCVCFFAAMEHGVKVGQTSSGVDAFNCNYDNNPLENDASFDRLSYIKDRRGCLHHSGSKWQCVEFARRYWIQQLDVKLPNVMWAYHIWNLQNVRTLEDGKVVPLLKFTNGQATSKPQVGDLLIWQITEAQSVGHVAVIVEVTDSEVRVGEQNADNNIMWAGGIYARSFPLQCDESTGAFTIVDAEDPLQGWVRCNLEAAVAPLAWLPPPSKQVPCFPISRTY
jgi:hypothetical protein